MEIMKEERKFLEQLAKQHNGYLMVDDVLNAAKDPQCILHKHFQWDDSKAAEAYRKMQARHLIQKCTVTVDKAPDVPVRAFVSLAQDQYSGGGYRMTVDVLSNEDLKAQLIHEMTITLIKWRKRIELLDKEEAAVIEALEGAIKSVGKSIDLNQVVPHE